MPGRIDLVDFEELAGMLASLRSPPSAEVDGRQPEHQCIPFRSALFTTPPSTH